MIYLIVISITLISIAMIIMLFDRDLYSRLSYKISNINNVRRYLPLKREKLKSVLKFLPFNKKPSVPLIPVFILMTVSTTAVACYFLITYSSLAVHHNQDISVATRDSQIGELLMGERLSPPPATPAALFAELDAEIASYQATQVDEGYWPDAIIELPQEQILLRESEPNMTAYSSPNVNQGYSGDMLASHLNNGQISIKNADRNWQKMNSEFVQRLLTVYKVMKDQYGYDMVLLEGYRSPGRQARLLNQGKHVTGAGAYKSYHQFGLAGDSAFIRNGKIVITEKDPWAMQGYQLYGKVAKSAGLVWGGDWRLMDLGHVELRKKGVLGNPEMANILTSQ